jgi:hypothetical protein
MQSVNRYMRYMAITKGSVSMCKLKIIDDTLAVQATSSIFVSFLLSYTSTISSASILIPGLRYPVDVFPEITLIFRV